MVNDVVEGGPPPRPRRPIPRWVWTSIVSALIGVLATAAVLHGGSHPKAGAQPSPSSPAPPSSSAATPTTSSLAAGTPWPTSPSACRGSSVYLPSGNLAQDYSLGADATLLVGNRTISHVDAVPPTSAPVAGLPSADAFVSQLVAGPDADYAGVASCEKGLVGLYRIINGIAKPVDIGGATDLLGGAHHAWAVRGLPPGVNGQGQPICPCAVLRPLDGGRSIMLDGGNPLADVSAGLIVSHSDPVNPDAPPILELVDPATGTITRTLGAGWPMGATGNTLLVQRPECGSAMPPPHCSIVKLDLVTGKLSRSYPLPADSIPVSDAVFSTDGTLAAFQLARQGIDSLFKSPDPFPPSEIMVLHLDTGDLYVVPNLYLAPKTNVGLAIDKVADRLWITVDRGDYGELLVWQPGMAAPAVVTSLPGPLQDAPPILLDATTR